MIQWGLKVILVAGTLWMSAGAGAWALEFVAERSHGLTGRAGEKSSTIGTICGEWSTTIPVP